MNDINLSPAGLSSMTALRTLIWLPSKSTEPLPNGVWTHSLRHIALPASLAVRSVQQLQLSTRLETLCITDWAAKEDVQDIVSLAQQLPRLARLAYSCAPGGEQAGAVLADAVAALQQHRPRLRVERGTAACLAELEGHS